MKTPEEWSLIFGRSVPESLKVPGVPDKLQPPTANYICVLDETDIGAIQQDARESALKQRDEAQELRDEYGMKLTQLQQDVRPLVDKLKDKSFDPRACSKPSSPSTRNYNKSMVMLSLAVLALLIAFVITSISLDLRIKRLEDRVHRIIFPLD